MIIAFAALPAAYEFLLATAAVSSLLIANYYNNEDAEIDDDIEFYSNLKNEVVAKNDSIAEIYNSEHTAFEQMVIDNSAPIVKNVEVTTTPPIDFVDYISRNSELVAVLAESTKNLVTQTKFQNELLAKGIQTQINGNANSRLVGETLASSLPSLVALMQQVSKIPIVMKQSSEITTAYSEQNLVNNEALLTAVNELAYASNTNALQTAGVGASLQAVASNAVSQKKIADHQTTVAQITRMDGSVYAELTPLELAIQTNVALVESKTKEKEISDYRTKEVSISNSKDELVFKAKPIELEAIKDAVNARNEMDEHEFELDNEILDHVFDALPLPSFTHGTVDKDNAEILSEMENLK